MAFQSHAYHLEFLDDLFFFQQPALAIFPACFHRFATLLSLFPNLALIWLQALPDLMLKPVSCFQNLELNRLVARQFRNHQAPLELEWLPVSRQG
ncbi:MAG TPA: hypothetical protein DEP36_09875 [Gammaproteobacteria bacterium]|nr:hypothetical protein [Gammaproteobacteria bacterium]